MPTLRLPDAEIAYTLHGPASDTPVLFVPGLGLSGASWRPQVEAVARTHRCIVIDNRGIGDSRGETDALTVELMARDVLAVLDAEGARQAHLVGHSLGGVIIQRLALLALERVKSLCFVCSFAGGQDLDRWSRRFLWYGAGTRLGSEAMRKRAFARLVLPDAYIAHHGMATCIALLEAACGRSLAEPPATAAVQLRALRAHDQRNQLGRLAHLRCLVLSGKLDPFATHEHNVQLSRLIGTARHYVWKNASHALPIQLADAVNEALVAHLSGERVHLDFSITPAPRAD